MTFGVLAERTGLARPSVYEYFRTKSEIIVALIEEEEMPAWRSRGERALVGKTSPEAAIGAFVHAVLSQVRAGHHDLPFAIAASELDENAQGAIERAHRGVFELLIPHLQGLGVIDVESGIALTSGVVMTMGQALRRTPRRRGLIEMAVAFTVGGLRACARRT